MSSCGEALLKLLENYGVDTVFGIPGVHTVELYRGLPATGIRHVTPRHEQGAGFMADGYARVTGKPGVCLIITGPGMTNIATAMGQALADSIPLLVISSVNRREHLHLGEGRLHELPDQRAMLAGVCRFSHTLMRPHELPQVMARAFAVFASERPGPVHIELPLDVITADAAQVDTGAWPLPCPPAPAPAATRAIASALAGAQSPLLVVGGGALGAGEALRALAEWLDAPVINTVNAKGLLPASHPLAIGGSASSAPVREALAAADVVLAVGTEFGETDYDFFFQGPPRISGTLARVDIDSRQLQRNQRADIAAVGDADLTLRAIHHALAAPGGAYSRRGSGAGKSRAERVRTALAAQRDARYAAFFEAIRDALPDVIIAGDSTQPTYYAWLHYETEQPRRYFHSASGFGTLGYAIPAAIGASLGCPGVPVLALIGDGAAQFTLGELASAVEAGVDTIFLVWNNQGYGEIKRFMREAAVEEIGVDIHTPDFPALAAAMGLHGERVFDLAALRLALGEAVQRGGPSLIEVAESGVVEAYPPP
jgi:acetolactate synthase-1/2/3 large subunit